MWRSLTLRARCGIRGCLSTYSYLIRNIRWEFRTEQNDIAFALMFKSQRTGSSSEDGEFLVKTVLACLHV